MDTGIKLIERELKCLSDFKSEMKEKFENRKPAELTLDFINKTNLEMQKQTNNLENITKTLDTHVQDQKVQDAKIQVKLEENQTAVFDKLNETQSSISKFIEGAGKLYASKSFQSFTTKLFWAIGLLTLGAIATAVFKLIFK